MRQFNLVHFNKFQYGLRSNGVESITHLINFNIDKQVDFDLYTIDADNAFNSANRVKGLQEVKRHCPQILPFLRSMYLCKSNGWYFGMSSFIKEIGSSVGYHQGDVLASWLYMMTNQPMLEYIDAQVRAVFPEAQYEQLWYVDDGNIHAPRGVMKIIVQTLKEVGPSYGYNIKMDKGSYLIGKCNNYEEALKVADEIVAMGINPDIIKMHFSNYNNGLTNNQILALRQDYGVKILGSYIGTKEFIMQNLQCYAEVILKPVALKLVEHLDLQESMILFRTSFVKKYVHLFRTIAPSCTQEFVSEVDKINKYILCGILGCEEAELSELTYNICKLSIHDGGLGIGSAFALSRVAFVASLIDFHKNHNNRLSVDQLVEDKGEYYNEFHTAAGQFVSNEFGIDALLSLTRENKVSIQQQLYAQVESLQLSNTKEYLKDVNTHHLVWFNGLLNNEAGKWLEALPVYEKFHMSPMEFRTSLRYRLFMKMANFVPGASCSCARHPVLDQYGHHLSTGCGVGAHTIATHNYIRDELNSALKYAGYFTKKEEKDLFINGLVNVPADNTQKNLRPDISVINYEGNAQKLLLDIRVASTLAYANNQLAPVNVIQLGRAADHAHNEKIRKYGEVCQVNGFSFKPIIFESNGFVHAETVSFIKRVAKSCASTKKIPHETIFNYLMKGLSMALQKGLANAILKKFQSLAESGINDYALVDKAVFDDGFRIV